jgi:hypothetical protein
MYGETSFWYGHKIGNDIRKSCLMKCIDEDSLSTKNLSQKDKLCSRNCITGASALYAIGEDVNKKWTAQHGRGETVNKH